MFQRPLGYIFLLPAFSSHLLVRHRRRLVRFSLMCASLCVCVSLCCGVKRGRRSKQPERCRSESLHFGIRTGSGLNRGNMTSSPFSSLPPSLYPLTFPCIPSSSLCPPPLPLPIHKVTSVFFWSRELSYGCHIHFCGVPERTLNYTLLTSCVNKSMLTSDF